MDVAHTFVFLLGAWQVSRTIEDRRAKVSGTFEGSALLVVPPEWQARGVWARYDETGTLEFGGRSGPARCTLGYMRRQDGTVAIFFPDGSPYIDLDLRTGSCERDHPCREDQYHLEFRSSLPGRVRGTLGSPGPGKGLHGRDYPPPPAPRPRGPNRPRPPRSQGRRKLTPKKPTQVCMPLPV